MPIEGVVARIIDHSTVIVNKGSKDGVRLGMRFVVFTQADEVTDPQTGEALGRWELVKGYIQAAHVQEAMTSCSPGAAPGEEEGREDPTKPLSSEMIAVSRLDRRRPGERTLEVNPSQVAGRPAAGPVSVGDRVRSLE